MGVFDKMFPKKNKKGSEVQERYRNTDNLNEVMRRLNSAYKPAYTSYSGGIYEIEQVRSAISAGAKAFSKLSPVREGKPNGAHATLIKRMRFAMNDVETTSQFLYRVFTLYNQHNNVIILPKYADAGMTVIKGFYAHAPRRAEIVRGEDHNGDDIDWLKFEDEFGNKIVIELSKVGLLRQYQSDNMYFGNDNTLLDGTVDLMNAQKGALSSAIANSSMIQFIMRLSGTYQDDDIEEKRDAFNASQLNAQNNKTSAIVVDSTIAELKQIDYKPYVIDADQERLINERVYDYFGVNDNIIKNKYTDEEWTAFYEGVIEPVAIQLSQVMTKLMFTEREIDEGGEIRFTSTRVAYASMKEKIDMVKMLTDRGIITTNQSLEMLGMDKVDDGDVRTIRKEYGVINDDGTYDSDPYKGFDENDNVLEGGDK